MRKVTKITKHGFGQSIGSSLGFGSWTLGATSIEMEVDIDLDTEEGKEEFKATNAYLYKVCMHCATVDLAEAKTAYPELKVSFDKRQLLVERCTE